MEISDIKLIVFDIDGTLAETDDYFVQKGVNILRKIIPFTKPEHLEKVVRPVVMAGETVLHYCYHLLDRISMDRIISKAHSKMSVSQEYKYAPVDGMRETVENLSKRYALGIISSGGRKSTDAFLDKYSLRPFISYIVSSEDCKYIKPHPLALLTMAEKANTPIENCLMVGDTVFDILSAKRAGAMSAAVKTGFDTTRFLGHYKADLMMDSVKDLQDLLKPS